MLEYALIVTGFIIIFVTFLPPTWYVDVGTLLLGALFLILGINEMIKKDKSS